MKTELTVNMLVGSLEDALSAIKVCEDMGVLEDVHVYLKPRALMTEPEPAAEETKPEPAAEKPKRRKRRTKAEIEAEKSAPVNIIKTGVEKPTKTDAGDLDVQKQGLELFNWAVGVKDSDVVNATVEIMSDLGAKRFGEISAENMPEFVKRMTELKEG